MKKFFSLCLLILSIQLMGQINWSTPLTISTQGVNASNPILKSDANGNQVALWLENGLIKSQTLPFNGVWSASSTISGSGASAPALVVDPAGNATAAWVQGGSVLTATKLLNQAWSAATLLALLSSSPQLAVDPSGDVVAVWVIAGGIDSSTKLFGGSWQLLPDSLSLINGSDSPQIAIGANKTVVAVWHAVSSVSSMNTIYAARKVIGTSAWTAAATISNSSQNSVHPQIGVDLNGNAAAIWWIYNLSGTVYSNVILQSSYLGASGSSWSAPVNVSQGGVVNPANLSQRIVFDGSGNAIAGWTTSFDGNSYNVESATLDFNKFWSGPTDLSIDTYSLGLDLKVTTTGAAFASYMITELPNVALQSAQSQVGGLREEFWGFPTTYTTASANNAPQISVTTVGANNYAASIWMAYNGSNSVVQASTGSDLTILPPSNLAVVQTINNFGVFTEYENTFSWTASADPAITNYLVFRNGLQVGQVFSSSPLQFIDHNRTMNVSDVYGVTAVDSNFNQSTTITISSP